MSKPKVESIDASCPADAPSPVFTVDGKYTARGWTEWTRGFQYGSQLLQFDATGDAGPLESAQAQINDAMASHLTHTGVHDHGFNIISTYGNLRRLKREGRIEASAAEVELWTMALRVSGAVQAMRWSDCEEGLGYIYSFNGPHSLFADTIRSLRSLAVAHSLGQHLGGEGDVQINLLERLLKHAESTARWVVFYGEGRDVYDLPGRVAHESHFDVNNGAYRCSGTQQGYSAFSTWTRGHAWVLLGFAEQLEYLQTVNDSELEPFGGRESIEARFLGAATATADFYLSETPSCGVPYWDTGAPKLGLMGDWRSAPADPYNDHEPVDSSAAAIACQGLIRLGTFLGRENPQGLHYLSAGLTVMETLLRDPYLSRSADHQGLLLHSVYHVPNGWDHVHDGCAVPNGEACMWGDYHLREAALLVQRLGTGGIYPTFF